MVNPLSLDLLIVIGLLVAIGVLRASRALSNALALFLQKTFGRIWIIGGDIDKAILSLFGYINNALSEDIDGLQGKLGEYWHAWGNLIASVGNEIVAGEDALWRLVKYVVYQYPVHVIGAVAHHALTDARHVLAQLRALTARVEHAAQALSHPWTGPIASGVKAGTRAINGELGRIEHWIGTRGRALEYEAGVAIPRDIAGLRARARAAERTFSRLWKQVRRLERVTVGVGAVALVASAIARMGGGWIFCRNWNRVGRTVCRTPLGDLEALLALLATGAVIADFRELVKLAQSVEHGAAVVIQDIAKV